MVRDTSLKGTSVGNGASCECGTAAVILLLNFDNVLSLLRKQFSPIRLLGRVFSSLGDRVAVAGDWPGTARFH